MFLILQGYPKRKEPIHFQKSFVAAKRGFPDLAPSPEVADHPFKRKDVGIKENLWREACCAEIGSRSNWRGAVEEEFLAFQMPSKQSIVDWRRSSMNSFKRLQSRLLQVFFIKEHPSHIYFIYFLGVFIQVFIVWSAYVFYTNHLILFVLFLSLYWDRSG